MKIMVLIAGVLDPKWPVTLGDDGLPARGRDRLVLSPFDEAALELALKIRDARQDVELQALVAGGPDAEKLAKAICALNVPNVSTLAIHAPWDQAVVARSLAAAATDADLILIGREFGDCDDGLVPPMLAGLLDLPYFGRVQTIEASPVLRLMREAGSHEEWLSVHGRLVASATNDRRNRLRKPLMKNVMQARQVQILHHDAETAIATHLTLGGCTELAGARTVTECRMIDGDVQTQARALAALLCGERI